MLRCLALFFVGIGLGTFVAAEAADSTPSAALKPLQDFVGQWKGVGQPKRGSSQGGWIEQAEWRWDFTGKQVSALVFTAPQSKHLVEGKITPGSGPTDGAKLPLQLQAKTADGGAVTYTGELDPAAGALTFSTTDDAPESAPHRITIRFAAEKKRLVALLERRGPMPDAYLRLAEVGYTRQGSGFGEGKFEPECIVTGGAGTMAFTYKGKTYYVCCTGCRDLFNDDPETYVAAYEEKLKKSGLKP